MNTHLGGFTPANALGLVRGYDVVLDATDNPATRYLIKCVGCVSEDATKRVCMCACARACVRACAHLRVRFCVCV